MRLKHGQWPAPCRGAPRAPRCRCKSEQMYGSEPRDEIQLSQSATQAANREGSGDSLRLIPDWPRTGYSNGRGE
eukprot:scaffold35841_cov46-Phaeocystis_antarctica.AAC.6